MELKNKYEALRGVASILKVAGVIVAFAGIFIALSLFQASFTAALGALAATAVLVLCFFAGSQLYLLFINLAADTEIIKKHIETQTSLQFVLAQHNGVDTAVLNEICADIDMEIPDGDSLSEVGIEDQEEQGTVA